MILDFDGKLDRDRMSRTLRLIVDAEPVFGCRFVPRFIFPYWKRYSKEELDGFEILEIPDDTKDTDEKLTGEFLSRNIQADKDLPVRAMILKGNSGDRLLLKLSHQVVDAGGTKAFAYLMCEIYNRLNHEPSYYPEPNLADRGMGQLYSKFSILQKTEMLGFFVQKMKELNVPYKSNHFDLVETKSGRPTFTLKRFSKERVLAIDSFAKSHGATLNDIIVAAMLRTLAIENDWQGESAIRLLGTVDYRKYFENEQTKALCNLSGFSVVNLGVSRGNDLSDTLLMVKEQMDQTKKHYFGLGLLLGMQLSLIHCPFALKTYLARKLFAFGRKKGNSSPGLTNLGPIKKHKLQFDKLELLNAEILVPPAVPPFFFTGVSGFNGTLTFSGGFFESSFSGQRANAMFETLDKEFPV